MNVFWTFWLLLLGACIIPPLAPLFIFGAAFILVAYAWQLIIVVIAIIILVWIAKKVSNIEE